MMKCLRSFPARSSIVHDCQDRDPKPRLDKSFVAAELLRYKHVRDKQIKISSVCKTTDGTKYLELHSKFDTRLDRGEKVPKPVHIRSGKYDAVPPSLTITSNLPMGENESFQNLLFTKMESGHPRFVEYQPCSGNALQTEVGGNAKHVNVWQSLAKTGRGSKTEKIDQTKDRVCPFSKGQATGNLQTPRLKDAAVHNAQRCMKLPVTQQLNDHGSNTKTKHRPFSHEGDPEANMEGRTWWALHPEVSEEEAHSPDERGQWSGPLSRSIAWISRRKEPVGKYHQANDVYSKG